MKIQVCILASLWVIPAMAQNYFSPLRITSFDRSTGSLRWTNQVGANKPVYEMLRTTTVTGNWQHFFFITNATSTTLTNSQGADVGSVPVTSGSVFHKLRWHSDTPISFAYEFDEGWGAGPCVSGQITFALGSPPLAGAYQLAETGICIDGFHPTGSGILGRGLVDWTATNHTVRFFFGPGVEGVYFEGILQSTITNGQLAYTGISGIVYESGFAGTTELGTFTAQRTQ